MKMWWRASRAEAYFPPSLFSDVLDSAPRAPRVYRIAVETHHFFHKYPKLANSCTGFVTFTIGDLASQFIAAKTDFRNRRFTIDYWRAVKTGALGVVLNGFALHIWFRALDATFGASMKTLKNVMYKCVADQLIYAPFSIVMFFSYASATKGGTMSDIIERSKEKLRSSMYTTWLADCSVWPMVNFLNFRYIPIHFRPSFVCCVQLAWQVYMSGIGHSEEVRQECFELFGSEFGEQDNSNI